MANTALFQAAEGCQMLVVVFILLIMWALGMISSYTFGGAIHLLLVVALIVLVIRLTQGRVADIAKS